MFLWISVLIPVALAGIDVRLHGPCELPLDRGTDCNNNATTRYFMDKERLQCFPFKYLGCGGNENNYETIGECSRCLPMDLNSCPGNTDPVRRADGSAHCNQVISCPQGATCRSGYAVGLCCSNESIKKQQSDSAPSCPSGKEAVKSERFGFQLLHTGRSCDHDFCPRGTSCHTGEYIAYCCK